MLASVPSLPVAVERFLSGRGRRVILCVVFPVEQIRDGPMLAIVCKRPLTITEE
jgi:hypothetical protein